MVTTVDARFAGGSIVVDVDPAWDSRPALVEVNLPGLTVGLFPDEARRLAVALIENAARAEAPEPGDWP